MGRLSSVTLKERNNPASKQIGCGRIHVDARRLDHPAYLTGEVPICLMSLFRINGPDWERNINVFRRITALQALDEFVLDQVLVGEFSPAQDYGKVDA